MFLLSFLIHHAFAEAIFVSPPEIRGEATKAHVDDFFRTLLKELSTDKTMQIRQISEIGSIRGETAQEYMDKCVVGERAGCAFLLADTNKIPIVFAMDFEKNTEVRLIIIRTSNGAIVKKTLTANTPDELAQQAVVLLTKVHNGTYVESVVEGVKKEEATMVDPEKKEETPQPNTQETFDYQGDVLPPIRIRTDDKSVLRLTKANIDEMKQDEGSKEWDKYEMDPDEYLRFINSGLSLMRWKNLKQGRKNKFIIRVGGGLGFMPTHALYYGRTVYSDIDTTLVEAYAWQTPQTDVSVVYQATLSYGLTPELDIGVGFGQSTGRISLDLWSQKAGQTPYFREENISNPVILIEPEISFVPKITSMIRPIASVGMSFLFGYSTSQDVSGFINSFACRYYDGSICNTAFEPIVEAPFLAQLKIQPGVEMSFNSNLDVWARVPLSYVLFTSNSPAVLQEGGGALPERERDLPGGYTTLGIGVLFGVQTRFDPFAFTKKIVQRD